jgi:hypothetical protein
MSSGQRVQQPFEIGFAHRQWQLAQIVSPFGEGVEGAKLNRRIRVRRLAVVAA